LHQLGSMTRRSHQYGKKEEQQSLHGCYSANNTKHGHTGGFTHDTLFFAIVNPLAQGTSRRHQNLFL
jgi:hypothetical protein